MTISDNNFFAAQAFVEFGLREQRAGRRESASGPGSTSSAADACLKLIDMVVEDYAIGSVLDLGCGDWNWMQRAAWRNLPGVRYEGWEAHPGLVEALNTSFGDDRTRFRLADITATMFPPADLVICRDVLFHLPLDLAEGVVRRLRDNGGLLISTSFLTVQNNIGIQPYLPIEKWGFYRINLDAAPFNLGPFRRRAVREPECSHRGHERSICLYELRP